MAQNKHSCHPFRLNSLRFAVPSVEDGVCQFDLFMFGSQWGWDFNFATLVADICQQWAHVLTKPIVQLPRSALTLALTQRTWWCSLGSPPTSNKHFVNSYRDYHNVCTVQINWDQYLQGFCNVSNRPEDFVCIKIFLSLYHISNSWAAFNIC